jgi:hypothetical protein
MLWCLPCGLLCWCRPNNVTEFEVSAALACAWQPPLTVAQHADCAVLCCVQTKLVLDSPQLMQRLMSAAAGRALQLPSSSEQDVPM